MFIAQIKAPIHHPLSCGWSGSACTVLCSLAGCLKLQRLMGELSRAPSEMHTDAAKPFELSKRLTVITSGGGGEEEARTAALGEDYQVLKALSAGSLMLVLGESSLVCLGHAWSLMDSGASPSMPWTG